MTRLTREKEFKKIEQQLNLLQKERNLIIKDNERAKDILLSKNYFNIINGFETLLLNKEYQNGSSIKKFEKKTFGDFERIFYLDRKIANLLFHEIEKIELELKTKLSYYFCEKHCSNGIEDNLNYENIRYYTVPTKGSGPDRYINYFYTTRRNHRTNKEEIFNQKTHTLLKKHKYNNVLLKKCVFTGNVSRDSNKRNIIYLKGKFVGIVNNSKNNHYKGTLQIDLNKTENEEFIDINLGQYENHFLEIGLGNFLQLSYSDYLKIRYSYISSYNNPPFWVVINTLMFNDLIILFLGMDVDIQQKIYESMGDFNRHDSGLEKFINSLQIINDLRNYIAHYGMSTRYRTPNNLTINSSLINSLRLNPKTNDKVLCLVDTLKILNGFDNFSYVKIKKAISRYKMINIFLFKKSINEQLDIRLHGTTLQR